MKSFELNWREHQLLDALEYALDIEDSEKAELIRAELFVTQQERDSIRAGAPCATWF